jgi:hypothetical protein
MEKASRLPKPPLSGLYLQLFEKGILDFRLPPYNPRGERMEANSLGTLVHLLSYFPLLFS